jgi:hypothetical protein
MNENTAWTTIACTAIACLALASIKGCQNVEETKREAYRNGLEEVQMEGSTLTRLGRPSHQSEP